MTRRPKPPLNLHTATTLARALAKVGTGTRFLGAVLVEGVSSGA